MRTILYVFCLAASALLAARTPAAPAPPRGDQPLHERLANVADFDEIDDPQTTLERFLKALTERFGIPFIVNETAFRNEGIQRPLKQPVSEEKIPAHKSVRIDRYLKTVFARIQLQQSAVTWMIRRDAVEITTVAAAQAECGPRERPSFLPLVHGRFAKKPMEEVIRALADQADYNVLLDRRAGKKAQAALSAHFANVPLDSAVSLLADSVDLGVYQHGNVLYVTTRQSAAAWEKRRQAESARPEAGPPAPAPMPSTGKGEAK